MIQFRTLAYRCATMALVLVFVSGCGSSVDPFGPTVHVSLIVTTPAAERSTLYVSFDDRSVSLRDPEGSVNQVTAKVRGMGYGSVPARFTLIGSSGDTLASASFTQELHANYRYDVAALIGRDRLLSICSATVSAIPLRNSMSDSMFVLTMGIPNGAIC